MLRLLLQHVELRLVLLFQSFQRPHALLRLLLLLHRVPRVLQQRILIRHQLAFLLLLARQLSLQTVYLSHEFLFLQGYLIFKSCPLPVELVPKPAVVNHEVVELSLGLDELDVAIDGLLALPGFGGRLKRDAEVAYSFRQLFLQHLYVGALLFALEGLFAKAFFCLFQSLLKVRLLVNLEGQLGHTLLEMGKDLRIDGVLRWL